VLKLIYYHLVSDFNMGPRILHTRLHPESHRLNIFPLEAKKNSGKRIPKLLLQFKYSWPNSTKRKNMKQNRDLAKVILLVLNAQSTDQENVFQL